MPDREEIHQHISDSHREVLGDTAGTWPKGYSESNCSCKAKIVGLDALLWCWERLRAGGEGDCRGSDSAMASLTQWTWVWANSRRWWRTAKPGILQSMGSQKVGHDLVTELNWTASVYMFAFPPPFFRFLRNMTERTKLTNTYHSLKLDLESWSAHPLSSPELYSVETSGYMYSFPFKSRTELSLNLISLFLFPKALLYPTKSS